MGRPAGTLRRVRESAGQKLLFLPHAVRQMSRPDRMITPTEIRSVIRGGELIEDYPRDARGHSCLILGHGENGRPVHVVCAPEDGFLAIITAYLPDPNEWSRDFKTRKNK